MRVLTPPPIRVELHRVPPTSSSGGEMEFALWFGPLAIHWLALIEGVSDTGFTDRQLSGPFAQWEHRHSFVQLDDQTSEVVDRVTLQLKPNLIWGAVGLGFLLGLPILFAYRARKTCRLLEKGFD
jgi:ligand-binding SRPBCC domain-containing protein